LQSGCELLQRAAPLPTKCQGRAARLLQARARLADSARGRLQPRGGDPQRRAAQAAAQAGLIGGARGVRPPGALLKLPAHEVQLVEVGEATRALLQQRALLRRPHALGRPRCSAFLA